MMAVLAQTPMDRATRRRRCGCLQHHAAASCEVVEDAADAAEIGIAAKILLSGAIEAQCLVEFPQATAKKLTDAFLGSQDDWEDALIEDAIGELCNMIAGGWKSALGPPHRLPASPCRQSRARVRQTATHPMGAV